MVTISAIVITRNEAANIDDCLASLRWCDQIIVIDHGSTDDTAARARQAGAQVSVTEDWPGFGKQKQRALDAATSDWVISLDADERLSAAGITEIQAAIQRDERVAYALPRRSWFINRFIAHAGWSPDYVLRLAQRQHVRFSDDVVHERLIADGPTGKLREPIIHLSYRDLDTVLSKLNSYSSAGAQALYARGKTASLGTALAHAAWMFIRTYFIKRGCLDGAEGLMLAIANAENSYYKYLKLRQLSRSSDDQRIR